jgi:hypothetical protein
MEPRIYTDGADGNSPAVEPPNWFALIRGIRSLPAVAGNPRFLSLNGFTL